MPEIQSIVACDSRAHHILGSDQVQSLSAIHAVAIKRRVKQAVKYLNDFEDILVEEAKRQCVDGIICGHIHQPALRELQGVVYCNTGDWIEHCTALVEHPDGRLEIVWWHKQLDQRVTGAPADMTLAPRLAALAGDANTTQPLLFG